MALAGHAEDGPLAGGELGERLLAEATDRLAALASGDDDTGRPEATEVPRDEGLRESDVGDQFRDGRLALGETAHDAQAVDVGHDLVEGAKLTELFGLGDRRGDRAAHPGW